MSYQKIVDWFLDKGRQSQVIIILLLILVYLGYDYYQNQKKIISDYNYLELRIIELDSINKDLQQQLSRTKFNSILSKANDDTSPVPMWLVDVKTNRILWVNKAYEKKYLYPELTNREEFIGTDGFYVFGETQTERFKINNRMVYQSQRPLTFEDEVGATITKFPVKVGSYTYAIGGIEYINFR